MTSIIRNANRLATTAFTSVVLVCFFVSKIQTVSGATPRCDRESCNYYSMLASQPSPLFEDAGISFFQQCDCTFYGVTLPAKPTPYTSYRSCGRSEVTGSASTYMTSRRGRVVNGSPAENCKYPWTVLVLASSSQCGGSIIDSTHIITAAHCLRSGNYLIPAEATRVGVGSSDRNNLVYYEVGRIDRHPNYIPSTFDFDIAVLTLKVPLPENNPCIQPICLPTTTELVYTGLQCVVAGWGTTEESGLQGATILQEAIIPILDDSICSSSYGSFMMNDRKICAGYASGGIDSCKGDSGGPLFCADGDSWFLAGIVSFGNGCARPGYPGVYAHMMNLKGWVDSVIG